MILTQSGINPNVLEQPEEILNEEVYSCLCQCKCRLPVFGGKRSDCIIGLAPDFPETNPFFR